MSFDSRYVPSVLTPCCKLLPIGVYVVDRLFHQLPPRRMPFFPQVLQAAVDVSEYPGGPVVLTGGLAGTGGQGTLARSLSDCCSCRCLSSLSSAIVYFCLSTQI